MNFDLTFFAVMVPAVILLGLAFLAGRSRLRPPSSEAAT
jgi:hypothetical protein